MVSHPARLPAAPSVAALTARQREVLAFVEAAAASGRPPTRADIAQALGITRPTAQQHVVALERHGALRRLPGSRGLAPVRRAPAAASVHPIPVIGRVAAGRPVLAVEDASEVVSVADGLFRTLPDVLLRVEGDSMIGAGIFDRDLIAVELRASAESGEIVVARLGDEITVKRLRRRGPRIELIAENPAYPPVEVAAGQEFGIEGVVLGVIRRY